MYKLWVLIMTREFLKVSQVFYCSYLKIPCSITPSLLQIQCTTILPITLHSDHFDISPIWSISFCINILYTSPTCSTHKTQLPMVLSQLSKGLPLLETNPLVSSCLLKSLSQVYQLILKEEFPRICQELQENLNLVIEPQVGDWILYKEYTILRIYGCEKIPYKLRKCLTPRIFALEILRQRLDSDYIHFMSKNQDGTFRLPMIVGPFTIKNKNVS